MGRCGCDHPSHQEGLGCPVISLETLTTPECFSDWSDQLLSNVL